MKIYLGADHGGFELKEKVKAWLTQWGQEYVDCGNTLFEPEDDYPDFAFKVGESVAKDRGSLGIVICRSSLGMVTCANKVKGVRAASCNDTKSTHHAKHNDDMNVLGLSGDWTGDIQAKEIVKMFVDTPFSEEDRHKRRVEKIRKYEKQSV